jgi:hypothetical protein
MKPYSTHQTTSAAAVTSAPSRRPQSTSSLLAPASNLELPPAPLVRPPARHLLAQICSPLTLFRTRSALLLRCVLVLEHATDRAQACGEQHLGIKLSGTRYAALGTRIKENLIKNRPEMIVKANSVYVLFCSSFSSFTCARSLIDFQWALRCCLFRERKG